MLSGDEARLLKELRAARLSLRKVKAISHPWDECYELASEALSRVNRVLKDYPQPVAQPEGV